MSLLLIKLQTGEEILAEIEGDTLHDNNVLVTDAVVVVPTPTQEGMGLQFIPWSMTLFASDSAPVWLKVSSIIAEATPAEEIVAEHAKIFGRVYVPTPKIILG